jgi:hypothetical protein
LVSPLLILTFSKQLPERVVFKSTGVLPRKDVTM